jgi:uncharacterized protein (TIGR00251 family)
MKEILVKVKPSAGQNKVEKTGEDEFKVFLTAPAQNNQANKQLLKVLAKHFKLKPSKVLFKSGIKSRIKKIVLL